MRQLILFGTRRRKPVRVAEERVLPPMDGLDTARGGDRRSTSSGAEPFRLREAPSLFPSQTTGFTLQRGTTKPLGTAVFV